jgi:carbonic anhydrase
MDIETDVADRLLDDNRHHAAAFTGGQLGSKPTRQLAILTCMDTRIEPLGALGLEVGEAHVLRNAGGRVTDDMLRSLMVSTVVLGVRDVAIVQHDGCGMNKLDDTQLRATIAEATGHDPAAVDFMTFTDLDASVKFDVERVRTHEGIAAERVVGFVYDVATGRLRQVV